jgi:hypothetical protein
MKKLILISSILSVVAVFLAPASSNAQSSTNQTTVVTKDKTTSSKTCPMSGTTNCTQAKSGCGKTVGCGNQTSTCTGKGISCSGKTTGCANSEKCKMTECTSSCCKLGLTPKNAPVKKLESTEGKGNTSDQKGIPEK